MLDWTICKNPIIVLKDITCRDVESLIDYMYLGEVKVLQSELPTLVKAAEALKIKGLSSVEDEEQQHQQGQKQSGVEDSKTAVTKGASTKRDDAGEQRPAAKKKKLDNENDRIVKKIQDDSRIMSPPINNNSNRILRPSTASNKSNTPTTASSPCSSSFINSLPPTTPRTPTPTTPDTSAAALLKKGCTVKSTDGNRKDAASPKHNNVVAPMRQPDLADLLDIQIKTEKDIDEPPEISNLEAERENLPLHPSCNKNYSNENSSSFHISSVRIFLLI